MPNNEPYARSFVRAEKAHELLTFINKPPVRAACAFTIGAIALLALVLDERAVKYVAAVATLGFAAAPLLAQAAWKLLIKRTAAQFAAAHPR